LLSQVHTASEASKIVLDSATILSGIVSIAFAILIGVIGFFLRKYILQLEKNIDELSVRIKEVKTLADSGLREVTDSMISLRNESVNARSVLRDEAANARSVLRDEASNAIINLRNDDANSRSAIISDSSKKRAKMAATCAQERLALKKDLKEDIKMISAANKECSEKIDLCKASHLSRDESQNNELFEQGKTIVRIGTSIDSITSILNDMKDDIKYLRNKI